MSQQGVCLLHGTKYHVSEKLARLGNRVDTGGGGSIYCFSNIVTIHGQPSFTAGS